MKRILVVYYEMMLGGSTTSLIGFLKAIDKSEYSVDLQLYRNRGPLLGSIPEEVTLLKPALKYDGFVGRIIKSVSVILSGYYFKAKKVGRKHGDKNCSAQVISEFQARCLSRKNKQQYDYAIGYIEGWSDKYLAWQTKAEKKYAWCHSTFSKIAPYGEVELGWIKKVSKIVFVANDCRKAFASEMPQFTEKAITIENIFDSAFIRTRAETVDEADVEYQRMCRDRRLKLITVCRLSIKTKGLDRIVSCAKQLKALNYSFAWYIIGDGEDRSELQQAIQENNLEQVVILTGMKTNPYPFISKCDVMCMPSRWEGKPMTVTECKILGIPPVVTEYLSAREQIKTGTEGIVCENTDEAIIPVLAKLFDEPERIEKMRQYLLSNDYGNTQYMRQIESELLSD